MNQLCKVCGEPAAGFHFGAFTCEGCKSFFGRTYNNISAIAGCKNNGDCVINKKNRTACKACRLRKCLLVGMSKSGSRYGRRSNWFKIHCLLQEQQTQQTSGPGGGGGDGGGGGLAPGSSNFEQLARLHQMQARQTYQDKTNPCIKTAANLSPNTNALILSPLAAVHTIGHSPTQHELLRAAKFLNGVGAVQRNMPLVKSNTRYSDTPSDSGASSAGDPADDCTSNASGLQQLTGHERNCNSAHQASDANNEDTDERDRRRKQFLQIFRSHSEPLRRPFATMLNYSHLPPPPVLAPGTPTTHILPTLNTDNETTVSETITATVTAATTAAMAVAATNALDLQEEPIDLSLKSRDSHCSQLSNTCSSSSRNADESRASPQVITKPAPLDLTLVRSQTLTG